jgi:hypothetical protein
MLTKPHFEIKSHRNLSLKERWTGRDLNLASRGVQLI